MSNNNLKHGIKVLGEAVRKNSPSILTGVSVAGLVATTVMAVKVTPKAMRILEEKEIIDPYGNLNEPLTKSTVKHVVKATWRLYVPAASMGLFTIACIVGANSVHLRRNAALVSVYSLTEATLKEYQAKVVETIGEKKEQQVRDNVAADKVKNNPLGTKEVIITGSGETLCYDVISGRYFKSDIEKLRKIQNDLNHNLISDMWMELNELYDAIGLPHIALGNELGWNVDKMLDFNFSSTLADNGTPCLVLDHEVYPSARFR